MEGDFELLDVRRDQKCSRCFACFSGDNLIMNAQSHRPDPYEYLNAVQFLNDHFAFRKSAFLEFSKASWANEIGFKNKTALRLILTKQRRISDNSTELFIKNLQMSFAEAEYFRTLVLYSQAASDLERQSFGSALIKLQRQTYAPIEVKTTQALANAISPIILTLLGFEDVEGTITELSRLLDTSETAVSDSLEELLAQGLIHKNERGSFVSKHGAFKISDKAGDPRLRRYHEHWIDQAKAAIDLDPKIRKFRALKFSLAESEFENLLERINDFAITVLSTYNSKKLQNRRLYMLEMLLFPIANMHRNRIHDLTIDLRDDDTPRPDVSFERHQQ
jgi:uncharacterized protein (TIGR02147 family)